MTSEDAIKYAEQQSGIKLTWYQKAILKTMDNSKICHLMCKNNGRQACYDLYHEIYKILNK